MTADKMLGSYYTKVSREEAEKLHQPRNHFFAVKLLPPQHGDMPATVEDFVNGILEIQTKWLGLVNTSPVTAFEIHRPTPSNLFYQFVAPSERLSRKIRSQLVDEIPGIGFGSGVYELPVKAGDSVGGGLLTLGKKDWYPLETEFDAPPLNAVSALLNRHAVADTKIVVQILFQPLAGRPVQNWWWHRSGFKHRNYLQKETENLWGSTAPTRREKRKAAAVDTKLGNARFLSTIRFTVFGAEEYTPSRVKEVSGGFNRFKNPETGQYFETITLRSKRRSRFLEFVQAVADREFAGWSRKFRITVSELAALTAIPDRHQQNIEHAKP